MRTISALAAVFVLATTGVAAAGGQEGSIGVGAEVGLVAPELDGLAGAASVNYDAGKFHVGGFFGLDDGDGANNTDYVFGGRFYWHLHKTAMSDFGLGGTIAFYSLDNAMGGDRAALLYFEPGFQIRAFITANVALSFTGGISLGLVDAGGATLGGQIQALAGIHYYFF